MQQAVMTSVPDPVRLVPSVAARSDPQWVCDKCQHINTGNKEACLRCKCANPSFIRQQHTAVDALTCDGESVVTLMTEKGHASLKKALTEAGTPLLIGSMGGTPSSIREALQRKGHERVLRIIYLLCTGPPSRMANSCNSVLGTFGMQRLLESAAKLRGQAYLMSREGIHLSEDFSSIPSTANFTAGTAYPKLIAALAAQSLSLVKDHNGFHVLVKAITLSPPTEVLTLANRMVQDFPSYSPLGQVSREASLFMSNVISRLCNMCYEATPAAPAAAEMLNTLLRQYRQHFKVYNAHCRHPYMGPALTEAIQGALPRADAFRACHMLACNAAWVSGTKGGVQTLTQTLSLLSDDPLARKMVRDIACTAALAMRPALVDIASSASTEGAGLVQQLLEVLSREREDDWVRILVQELVNNGARLEGSSASFDLLCTALSLGQIDDKLLQEHLKNLASAGSSLSSIKTEVEELRFSAQPLSAPFFDTRSEVQPDATLEFIRKRLPTYVWELVQQQKSGAVGGGATTTSAGVNATASTITNTAQSSSTTSQTLPTIAPAMLPNGNGNGQSTGNAYSYFEPTTSSTTSAAGGNPANDYGWGGSTAGADFGGWDFGSEYAAVGATTTTTAASDTTSSLPGFMGMYDHQSLFLQAEGTSGGSTGVQQSQQPYYYQQQQQSAARSSEPDPTAFFPQFSTSTSPAPIPTPPRNAAPPLPQHLFAHDQYNQQPQPYQQQFSQIGGGLGHNAFEDSTNTEEYDNLESMLQRLSAQDNFAVGGQVSEQNDVPQPYRPLGAHQSSFSNQESQPAGDTSVRAPVMMRFGSDHLNAEPSVQASQFWAASNPSGNAGRGPAIRPTQAVQYNANTSSKTTPAIIASLFPTPASGPAPTAVDQYSAAPPRPVVSAPVVQTGHWTCGICTYLHMGKEAEFLVCAVCGSQRPV